MVLAFLAAGLAACGGKPGLLKGQPPQVSVTSLIRAGSELDIALRVNNINQVPMAISRVAVVLTLGNYPVRLEQRLPPLRLDASTSEMVRFSVPLPAEIDRVLADVETGARASLVHELDGEITEQDGGSLKFRREGHLYPVPGKPGEFR